MNQFVSGLTTTATVIGFVVMAAWVVLIVWLISIVCGEFRFNRLLRRTQIESREARSSWESDMNQRARYDSTGGFDHPLHDTTEMSMIDFRFHPREDEFLTEETGAVFDLSERYPNEFA